MLLLINEGIIIHTVILLLVSIFIKINAPHPYDESIAKRMHIIRVEDFLEKIITKRIGHKEFVIDHKDFNLIKYLENEDLCSHDTELDLHDTELDSHDAVLDLCLPASYFPDQDLVEISMRNFNEKSADIVTFKVYDPKHILMVGDKFNPNNNDDTYPIKMSKAEGGTRDVGICEINGEKKFCFKHKPEAAAVEMGYFSTYSAAIRTITGRQLPMSDFILMNNQPFLISEFIKGESLQNVLDKITKHHEEAEKHLIKAKRYQDEVEELQIEAKKYQDEAEQYQLKAQKYQANAEEHQANAKECQAKAKERQDEAKEFKAKVKKCQAKAKLHREKAGKYKFSLEIFQRLAIASLITLPQDCRTRNIIVRQIKGSDKYEFVFIDNERSFGTAVSNTISHPILGEIKSELRCSLYCFLKALNQKITKKNRDKIISDSFVPDIANAISELDVINEFHMSLLQKMAQNAKYKTTSLNGIAALYKLLDKHNKQIAKQIVEQYKNWHQIKIKNLNKQLTLNKEIKKKEDEIKALYKNLDETNKVIVKKIVTQYKKLALKKEIIHLEGFWGLSESLESYHTSPEVSAKNYKNVELDKESKTVLANMHNLYKNLALNEKNKQVVNEIATLTLEVALLESVKKLRLVEELKLENKKAEALINALFQKLSDDKSKETAEEIKTLCEEFVLYETNKVEALDEILTALFEDLGLFKASWRLRLFRALGRIKHIPNLNEKLKQLRKEVVSKEIKLLDENTALYKNLIFYRKASKSEKTQSHWESIMLGIPNQAIEVLEGIPNRVRRLVTLLRKAEGEHLTIKEIISKVEPEIAKIYNFEKYEPTDEHGSEMVIDLRVRDKIQEIEGKNKSTPNSAFISAQVYFASTPNDSNENPAITQLDKLFQKLIQDLNRHPSSTAGDSVNVRALTSVSRPISLPKINPTQVSIFMGKKPYDDEEKKTIREPKPKIKRLTTAASSGSLGNNDSCRFSPTDSNQPISPIGATPFSYLTPLNQLRSSHFLDSRVGTPFQLPSLATTADSQVSPIQSGEVTPEIPSGASTPIIGSNQQKLRDSSRAYSVDIPNILGQIAEGYASAKDSTDTTQSITPTARYDHGSHKHQHKRRTILPVIYSQTEDDSAPITTARRDSHTRHLSLQNHKTQSRFSNWPKTSNIDCEESRLTDDSQGFDVLPGVVTSDYTSSTEPSTPLARSSAKNNRQDSDQASIWSIISHRSAHYTYSNNKHRHSALSRVEPPVSRTPQGNTIPEFKADMAHTPITISPLKQPSFSEHATSEPPFPVVSKYATRANHISSRHKNHQTILPSIEDKKYPANAGSKLPKPKHMLSMHASNALPLSLTTGF